MESGSYKCCEAIFLNALPRGFLVSLKYSVTVSSTRDAKSTFHTYR